MKQYKKKTIALCLAAALTVIGAFGEENYSNALMSMRFDSLGIGKINAVLYTRTSYEYPVSVEQRDLQTYVLTLKDTYSECKNTDIPMNGNIESVNIVTSPYTNNSPGETKIIIKTVPNTYMQASTALYLENKNASYPMSADNASNYSSYPAAQKKKQPQKSYWDSDDSSDSNSVPADTNDNNRKQVTNINSNENNNSLNNQNKEVGSAKTTPNTVSGTSKGEKTVTKQKDFGNTYDGGRKEKLTVVLAIAIISMIITFVFFMSKEKMASMIGEQTNFDFDDEDDNNKKKNNQRKPRKRSVIRRGIRELDSKYKNNSDITTIKNYTLNNTQDTQDKEHYSVDNNQSHDDIDEEVTIIDLDALYKEKSSQESAEQTLEQNASDFNTEFDTQSQDDGDFDDLAGFLDEFAEEKEPEQLYDEETYEKCLNSEHITFTKADIAKIEQLLQIEISDNFMELRAEYLRKLQNIPKVPTKEEIMENLIASYTIKQNISFTYSDVEALQKLMKVELDEDFITDLRTNPERTAEVMKELSSNKEPVHKSSDITILNVKDLLPDLSKELKKQGNKPIESNAKPEVIYCSEGYNVSKLAVGEEFANIANELGKASSNQHRPSYEIPVAESDYEYPTLKVSELLPDLNNTMSDTNKYTEENTEHNPIASEQELLDRINNVTLKPFYQEEDIPSESAVKAELNKFRGFEVVDNSTSDYYENYDEENSYNDNNNDTFIKTDTGNDIVDADNNDDSTAINKQEEETNDNSQNINETDITVKSNPLVEFADSAKKTEMPIYNNTKSYVKPIKRNREANRLLQLIETKQQSKKEETNQNSTDNEKPKIIDNETAPIEKFEVQKNTDLPQHPSICVFEGDSYKVVNVGICEGNSGCYLTKGENYYVVFGFINNNLFKLTSYQELNSYNIKMRLYNEMPNGVKQYLVKVSNHKFMLNLHQNSIEWVMDLC